MGTSQCDESTLKKKFVYNGEFTCEKGEEYFTDGVINFQNEAYLKNMKGQVRADSTYCIRFGPCVEHDAKIFENSNHNVSLAMRRLTRVRKADLELHNQLRANQLVFMSEHATLID